MKKTVASGLIVPEDTNKGAITLSSSDGGTLTPVVYSPFFVLKSGHVPAPNKFGTAAYYYSTDR